MNLIKGSIIAIVCQSKKEYPKFVLEHWDELRPRKQPKSMYVHIVPISSLPDCRGLIFDRVIVTDSAKNDPSMEKVIEMAERRIR